jgi:hypothetical protein
MDSSGSGQGAVVGSRLSDLDLLRKIILLGVSYLVS